MVRLRTAPADRPRSRDNANRAVFSMERETGFGPATLSLEG